MFIVSKSSGNIKGIWDGSLKSRECLKLWTASLTILDISVAFIKGMKNGVSKKILE